MQRGFPYERTALSRAAEHVILRPDLHGHATHCTKRPKLTTCGGTESGRDIQPASGFNFHHSRAIAKRRTDWGAIVRARSRHSPRNPNGATPRNACPVQTAVFLTFLRAASTSARIVAFTDSESGGLPNDTGRRSSSEPQLTQNLTLGGLWDWLVSPAPSICPIRRKSVSASPRTHGRCVPVCAGGRFPVVGKPGRRTAVAIRCPRWV